MKRFCDPPTAAAELVPQCPPGADPVVWIALPACIRAELSAGMLRGEEHSGATGEASATTSVKQDKKRIIPSIFKRSRVEEAASLALFTDADFPASAESIDGRSSIGKPLGALKCHCQRPARIRLVSKAGVNQGRYFHSCGVVATALSGRGCNFFAWAENAPHSERVHNIKWKRFTCDDGWCFVIPSRGFRAEDVLQGGVGNCWFLSAVAVVAERFDLMDHVVDSKSFLEDSSSRFRFFLDGAWHTVTVDNFLPYHEKEKGSIQVKGRCNLHFAKARLSQLWMPFLEKAYAKLHGSYDAISGGFISEAMMDLTCAPCETICFFGDNFDSDDTWERLLSFSNAKFPMGCSTDSTGEGIVGNHAYSILDVRQISAVKLGSQSKIKTFFEEDCKTSRKNPCDVNAIEDVKPASLQVDWDTLVSILPPDMLQEELQRFQELESRSSQGFSSDIRETEKVRSDVRLIRIRNPWGKQEWTGEMSKSSDLWTTKLLSNLQTGIKNDGTFWMFYHDFLRRFSSVDICKSFEDTAGWSRSIQSCTTVPGSLTTGCQYDLLISKYTWVYLYISQKTKRGRSRSVIDRNYFYSDISIIVTTQNGTEIVGAVFCGKRRDCVPLELHLDPGLYQVHIIHFSPHKRMPNIVKETSDLFSFVSYSNRHVEIAERHVPKTEDTNSATDILAAGLFKICLWRSISNQQAFGINASSMSSFLKYARTNTIYTCSPASAQTVISIDCEPDDNPKLHVLHGASDISFIALVNLGTDDTEVCFNCSVASRCSVSSPYIVGRNDHVNTEQSTLDPLRMFEFCLHVPALSLICAAIFLENSYTVEGGRYTDIKLSNCNYSPSKSQPGSSSFTGIAPQFVAESVFK